METWCKVEMGMAFKGMFAHRCQAMEVHHYCSNKHTGTAADIWVLSTCRFSKKPLHTQVVKEYDISLCYCHNYSLDSHTGILMPLIKELLVKSP